MRASVIVFPGTNREHDIADVLRGVSGRAANLVWHGDSTVLSG